MPRCDECSPRVALLRRAGFDDDGFWCPSCNGQFLANDAARSPVVRFSRYRRPEHQLANDAPGAPYQILERRDGTARLRIDGHEWILSPDQLAHLADSAENAAKWGRQRRDFLRGRYQVVVTRWGCFGYKVRFDDCERVLVPTMIRKPRECGSCGEMMRSGARAWMAEEPDSHPAHRIDWRKFRMCAACPERLMRPLQLLALNGGLTSAAASDP